MGAITWKSPAGILIVVVIATIVVGGLAALRPGWTVPPEEKRWSQRVPDVREAFTKAVIYDPDRDHTLHPPAIDYDFPNVAVYSAPAIKPDIPPLSIKDLSDHGQARVIELVASKQSLQNWSQIANAAEGISDGIEKKDPFRVDRVLVATVTKGVAANPGDRLVWTRVFVKPINFEFAGFTVAATANKTVKVADIETTTSAKSGFSPDFGNIGSLVPKASASGSLEQAHKTTAEIDEQFEELGIDIRPDFLRIIRESGTGGDVAGNTLINLSILTNRQLINTTIGNPNREQKVADKLVLFVAAAHLTDGAKRLANDTATLTVLPQNLLPHCSLRARVWMLYELRTINENSEGYRSEGRQSVTLTRNAEPVQEVEIVRADDIAPAVWTIEASGESANGTTEAGGQPADRLLSARAENTEDSFLPLAFSDYVTASQLIHWIKTSPKGRSPKLSELEFGYGQKPFEPSTVHLVPVKDTGNQCKEPTPSITNASSQTAP